LIGRELRRAKDVLRVSGNPDRRVGFIGVDVLAIRGDGRGDAGDQLDDGGDPAIPPERVQITFHLDPTLPKR